MVRFFADFWILGKNIVCGNKADILWSFLRRFQRRWQDKGVVDFWRIDILTDILRQFVLIFWCVDVFCIGNLFYDTCAVWQVIWIFCWAVLTIFWIVFGGTFLIKTRRTSHSEPANLCVKNSPASVSKIRQSDTFLIKLPWFCYKKWIQNALILLQNIEN